ncbi:MAG: tRNA lysidine(34) synthetase TilS [Gammaproteobacteria bacterium]|nr:tRNA lysidine(34) synthetase TilS [Gammaproteobacteria bacterium]
MAKIDHAAVLGPAKDRLRVSGLRLLSPERRRNVIRYWIRGLGLPLPATTHLHHVLSDVIDAAGDGVPVVSWSGAEVRRYRDLIYAMQPLGRRGEKKIVRWRMVEPLVLGHGSLVAEPVTGQGVSQAVCATGVVSVCYRSGGERCRQSGRGCHHTLKKLFQEYGVPTWERGWIPLVHIDNELAAVADLWVCEPFQAREEEAGWRLHWSGENRYRSE